MQVLITMHIRIIMSEHLENDKQIEESCNGDSIEKQGQYNCRTCNAGLRTGISMSEIRSDSKIAENMQFPNDKVLFLTCVINGKEIMLNPYLQKGNLKLINCV